MDEVTAQPPDSPPPATVPGPPAGVDEGICAVELPEFEGPLDLLLHLVRRHELDILDIPISFVCEKYLEYIEFMRAMDLEVAGDYLVMAATLAYLKSRELVPSGPLEAEETQIEDGPDPREELIARLLEYQTYRNAASNLDALPVSGRDTFERGQPVDLPPVDAGLAPITLFRLAEAYHRVLDRARILKSHEVVFEQISVSDRMQQLTLMLMQRERFDFEQIFLERTWESEGELRAMLVVTLMSILELVKLGIARVHQPEGATTLQVQRHASAEEAKHALAGYDEAASFGGAPAPEGDEDPGPASTAATPSPAPALDPDPAPEVGLAPEPEPDPPLHPEPAHDAPAVDGPTVIASSDDGNPDDDDG